MAWWSALIPGRRRREIDDEIAAHLQMAIGDRVERGEPPVQARDAAYRELGNVHLVTEATRSIWSSAAFEQLLQDLRFGSRILVTSPALSATAVVLIALVIGGNTTIFSMGHYLVTKPAPGVEAGRLLLVGQVGRPSAGEFSYPDYREYREQTHGLRPLIAFGFNRLTLSIGDASYGVGSTMVSPGYFETLGVRMVKGRALSDAEHQSGAALAAVISHRVWRDYYQSADDVVGRPVTLNGYAATIVGVAAPGFRGVFLAELADVWVPLVNYFRVRGIERELEDRASPVVMLMGRLAEGATFGAAQAEFLAVSRRLATTYPATNKDRIAYFEPYAMTAGTLIGDRAPVFLAIFSIVTLLTLIIVAANVANLMLARAVVRQRETAVRQSLGASRVRIIRMLIAEGLTLSVAAWAVACALAVVVSKVMLRILPPSRQGIALDPGFMPDWQVMGYAMVLAAIATLAFTLAPALRAWRQDVLPPLKAGEQSVAQGRSRVSGTLVVMQLAFSVVLLTSAGLVYRSLSLISGLDLGFDTRNVLLAAINTGSASATKAANLTLLDRVQQRLRAVPGVTAAGYARNLPMFGPAEYPVRRILAQEPVRVRRNGVAPGYLGVLGITLVAGRDFAAADGSRDRSVAIVNQNLADALWPGESAVGRSILAGEDARPTEIVGVTPNVLYEGFRPEARPYYLLVPDAQVPMVAIQPVLYVRHTGSLDTIAPALARAVRDVDAAVPILYQRTMDEQLEGVTEPFRLVTVLLVIFSGMSLLIAAIGQYAVVAFDMRRRTREFGVRLALGASSSQILRAVIREGLILTTAGLVLGFALSAAAAGAFGTFLYGVTPTDAPTYGAVFAVLATASLLACYLPAKRAASIDPVAALRQE